MMYVEKMATSRRGIYLLAIFIIRFINDHDCSVFYLIVTDLPCATFKGFFAGEMFFCIGRFYC